MPRFPSWSLWPISLHQNSECSFVFPLVFCMYWTSLSPCFCQFSSLWRELKSLCFYLRTFSVAPAFFVHVRIRVNEDDVLTSAVLLYFVALLLPLFTKQTVRQTVFVQRLKKYLFITEAKSRPNYILEFVVRVFKQNSVWISCFPDLWNELCPF